MGERRRTINIRCGKKLSGKSRDEILDVVLAKLQNVEAVQQSLDVVRVTFREEGQALAVLQAGGVRLFDMWCRVDGGPPTTIVHLFDYPYEDPVKHVTSFFSDFGVVKGVRYQKYLRNGDIATGTRLVDIVLKQAPPRLAIINGSTCRIWYRGQPVICNICATVGHKAVSCPYKNKCRLCEQEGHFARNCPNPWGLNTSGESSDAPANAGAHSNPPEVSPGASPSGVQFSSGTSILEAVQSVSNEAVVSPSVGSSAPPDALSSASPSEGSLAPPVISDLPVSTVLSSASPSEDSSFPPVGPDPSGSAPLVSPRRSSRSMAPPPQQIDLEEVFVDASDGSDIEDFTATPPSSSPAISEFSQSQSILRGAQIDVQNSQIAEQTSHGSVDRVVIQTSDVHSVTDVDSMDPSLASLKRRSRRPRNNSRGTKHRRVVSASPHGRGRSASPRGRGRHAGLPSVARDRPF